MDLDLICKLVYARGFMGGVWCVVGACRYSEFGEFLLARRCPVRRPLEVLRLVTGEGRGGGKWRDIEASAQNNSIRIEDFQVRQLWDGDNSTSPV